MILEFIWGSKADEQVDITTSDDARIPREGDQVFLSQNIPERKIQGIVRRVQWCYDIDGDLVDLETVIVELELT